MAWTYHAKDGATNIQCTPIIVDGILYAPTPGRALVAIDAASGVERWRFQVDKPRKIGLENLVARRGLVYWPGDAGNPARIIFGADYWVTLVDPLTGRAIPGFGENGQGHPHRGHRGRRHLRQRSPHHRTLRQCLWLRRADRPDALAIPHRGPGRRIRGRHLEQAAMGRRSLVRRGGRRKTRHRLCRGRQSLAGPGRRRPAGRQSFPDCLVALDVATGRRLWHFQSVRHDIWDLDTVGVPNLVTITPRRAPVDAVTVGTKGGILLLIDRVSGKPIFPSASGVPPRLPAAGRAHGALPAGSGTAGADPPHREFQSRRRYRPHAGGARFRPETGAEVGLRILHAASGRCPDPFHRLPRRGGMGRRGLGRPDRPALRHLQPLRVSKITVIRNDERDRDPRYPPSTGERLSLQRLRPLPWAGSGRHRHGALPHLALKSRLTDADVLALLAQGRGGMPANNILTAAQKSDLLDFLFRRRNQPPSKPPTRQGPEGGVAPQEYVFDGYRFLEDNEGYPGVKPPWGLLNCYDLNTGKVLWRVPLGELEKLTRQAWRRSPDRGLFGGATVTAGVLCFAPAPRTRSSGPSTPTPGPSSGRPNCPSPARRRRRSMRPAAASTW